MIYLQQIDILWFVQLVKPSTGINKRTFIVKEYFFPEFPEFSRGFSRNFFISQFFLGFVPHICEI